MLDRPLRRLAAPLLICVPALLAMAGPALAGSVQAGSGTLVYTAASGEQNKLVAVFNDANSKVEIEDQNGYPIAPTVPSLPFCTQLTVSKVSCTASNVTPVTFNLGDAIDEMSFGSWVGGNRPTDITVNGGDGNDVLGAAPIGTKLNGDAGNDALTGGAGNDTLTGGTGDDALDGLGGTDTVSYADRATPVFATLPASSASTAGNGVSGENDTIFNAEALTGGSAGDLLVGNNDANTISGGGGNDLIAGNAGADTLAGGNDDDVISGGTGNDPIDGGGGTDTVSYAERGSAESVTVTLASGNDDGVSGENDQLTDVDNAIGGAGDDSLTGTTGANRLEGGAGNDTLIDGDSDGTTTGSDVLVGGSGIDTASYAGRTSLNAIAVSLDGSANDGKPGVGGVGAEGDNVGGDVETVVGTAGDDALTGNAAPNTLDGRGGNDTLDGAGGADTLIGGTGTADVASYAGRPAAVTVTIDNAANDGEPGEGDNVDTTVENVAGGSGNDRLTGSSGANTLDGGAGDDVLDGGAEADVLNGGAGVDTADYSAGSRNGVTVTLDGTANDGDATDGAGTKDNVQTENVTGSPGGDTISGDTGANRLSGIGGDDALSGQGGDDVLDGGAGTDTVSGGDANDTLDGGVGADTLDGGNGTDTITYATRTAPVTVTLADTAANDGEAGEGDKALSAENSIGGTGADSLTGDGGANVLDGGSGVDVLDGRAGDDTLLSRDDVGDSDTCGDGADTVGADLLDTIASDCETVDRGPAPTLSIDDVRVVEGNGGTTAVTFSIALSQPTVQAVTVRFATVDGTAKAGEDYVKAADVLAFGALETTRTITVAVNGDSAFEGDEAFGVVLGGASNATIARVAGAGTIANDDAAPKTSPAGCTVPRLKGVTTATAKTRLRKAGCRLGRVIRRYSASVRRGRIVKSSPKAGTKAAAKTKVVVVVSKGRKPTRRGSAS